MSKEVAIIIPIYNGEKTIQKTLASIYAQTFSDFCKVVLINDDKPNKYDFLYAQFPMLDLVILKSSKPQSGPGAARNIGLEYVIAQNIPYILFVDADDTFYSNIDIEKIYSTIYIEKSDFCNGLIYAKVSHDCWDFIKENDIWLFGKIYKTEIIKQKNIRFMKTFVSEDIIFNFHYWFYINKASKIEGPLYIYQFTCTSLTKRKPDNYLYKAFCPTCKGIQSVLEKVMYDKDVTPERICGGIINKLIFLYLEYNAYYSCSEARQEYDEMDACLKNLYKKIVSHYWKNISFKKIQKIWKELGGMPEDIPEISFTDFLKIMTSEETDE